MSALLCTHNIFAQNYTHLPTKDIVKDAVLNDVNVYNIQQKIGATPTVFKWRKLSVSMPKTWEANICDVGHCYTSIVDSSVYDTVFVGDLGLISLHLNPKSELGKGIIKVELFDVNTPTKKDTLTWTISAKSTSTIQNTSNLNNILIYANGQSSQIEIQTQLHSNYQIQIYNNIGNLIQNILTNSNQNTIFTNNLSNGIYFLSIVENNKIIYTQKIVK